MAEKFIPYEKLSKKKQREIDRKKRGSWNGVNPVTRTTQNPKAYNRQKAKKWMNDSFHSLYFFLKRHKKSPAGLLPQGSLFYSVSLL